MTRTLACLDAKPTRPVPASMDMLSPRDAWLQSLGDDLVQLADAHLRRRLRAVEPRGPRIAIDGRELLHMAGNDYLGLSRHPHLCEAAIDAIRAHGVGSGASRLVSGHLASHQQLEQRFAAFKHAQAALLLPTGYLANLAVLTTLAGPGDQIFLDKLCHASLIDAARNSGATVRAFAHLDTGRLERLLARGTSATRPLRRFILTDSIFSMDGDAADLPRLCDLAQRYGAMLIVDEAHGTGVLGEHGAGLCEAQGVSDRVDVVISTASKALGGLGGIVTARRVVIDTLINRARPFIYTTAAPPAQAAIIHAALDVIEREPWRRQRVLDLARQLHRGLADLGLPAPVDAPTNVITPIVPVIVGSAERAVALAAHLESRGIFSVAIRPPTVPRNGARVRLTLRADHTDADIDQVLDALRDWTANHTL